MPIKKQEEVNPLFKKNIPLPPTTELETDQSEEKNGKTVSEENNIREERQTVQRSVASATAQRSEEKATIELSLYLRPAQDDKLEDLRRAYKRRTGKKISANEVMRRLIEQATLDALLEVSE